MVSKHQIHGSWSKTVTYSFYRSLGDISHDFDLTLNDLIVCIFEGNWQLMVGWYLVHEYLLNFFELEAFYEIVISFIVDIENDLVIVINILKSVNIHPSIVVVHLEREYKLGWRCLLIFFYDYQFLDCKYILSKCQSVLTTWGLGSFCTVSYLSWIVVIFTPVHIEAELFNNFIAFSYIIQKCVSVLIMENFVYISNIFQGTIDIFEQLCDVNNFIKITLIFFFYVKEMGTTNNNELCKELAIKLKFTSYVTLFLAYSYLGWILADPVPDLF